MMSEPGKITERIARFFFDQSPDYFLDKEVLSMVIAWTLMKRQESFNPDYLKRD